MVDGLLAWNTRRIGGVFVDHEPRREGRSGYSLWKLLTLALNLFTNFSLLPLQLVSALGLCVAAGGAVDWILLPCLFPLGPHRSARLCVHDRGHSAVGRLPASGPGNHGRIPRPSAPQCESKPQYTVRTVVRSENERDIQAEGGNKTESREDVMPDVADKHK